MAVALKIAGVAVSLLFKKIVCVFELGHNRIDIFEMVIK